MPATWQPCPEAESLHIISLTYMAKKIGQSTADHQHGWIFAEVVTFSWVVDDAKCIVVTRVHVSVCLSAAVHPHYCTDPDVTWGHGRGCPLVVHYWADLQSVHWLCCYGNITQTLVYAGCAHCWLVTGGWRRRSQHCTLYIASSWAWLAGRWWGAFSTLLRRPGLRDSNGGVLAT